MNTTIELSNNDAKKWYGENLVNLMSQAEAYMSAIPLPEELYISKCLVLKGLRFNNGVDGTIGYTSGTVMFKGNITGKMHVIELPSVSSDVSVEILQFFEEPVQGDYDAGVGIVAYTPVYVSIDETQGGVVDPALPRLAISALDSYEVKSFNQEDFKRKLDDTVSLSVDSYFNVMLNSSQGSIYRGSGNVITKKNAQTYDISVFCKMSHNSVLPFNATADTYLLLNEVFPSEYESPASILGTDFKVFTKIYIKDIDSNDLYAYDGYFKPSANTDVSRALEFVPLEIRVHDIDSGVSGASDSVYVYPDQANLAGNVSYMPYEDIAQGNIEVTIGFQISIPRV